MATTTPVIGPTEELMYEHGLLNRAMLIYKHALTVPRRSFPTSQVATAAAVIRTFVHDQHEEVEEKYIFKPMKRTAIGPECDILWDQHRAGKKLTERILSMTAGGKIGPVTADVVCDQIRTFVDMYEPHEAREDTVIFPTWRATLSTQTFDRIAEEIYDRQYLVLGSDAWPTALANLETAEKELGLYDLNQWTPKELAQKV